MKILILTVALIVGCKTVQPQVVTYCGTFHLYNDETELQRDFLRSGGEGYARGFYKDNEIHVMKWDFEGMGHEVYHGLMTRGLLVDKGFEHFGGYK